MKIETEALEKKVKAIPRKLSRAVKSSVKRAKSASKSRQVSKLGNLSDYTTQARHLIDRGKSAIDVASKGARRAAKAIPRAARELGLPDQDTTVSFLKEQPLVVGALGLGLGVLIGTLMPHWSSSPTTKRR